MTVAELITELQKLPPEMRVYVRAHESGVDDLEQIEVVGVVRNVNKEDTVGRHEHPDTALWFRVLERRRETEAVSGAVLRSTRNTS
jgi:hypothetical protein